MSSGLLGNIRQAFWIHPGQIVNFSLFIDMNYNDQFLIQIKAAKLPIPYQEYRFHNKRRWRVDFMWKSPPVIFEIEGGVFSNGRHVRGIGFSRDCEKYNEATLLGYQLFRVTPEHILSGKALNWLERVIKVKKEE